MLKLHFKVSVWRELSFIEGTPLQEIVDAIQGTVYDAYDMESFIGETDLLESEELLHPTENNDQPTIEIFSENTLVWSNWETETII